MPDQMSIECQKMEKKYKKIVVLKNKDPNISDEKCKSDLFSI